ncbi:MAG TPA: tetratricopeptide repeat protein [Micromonosporaceae bacterium]
MTVGLVIGVLTFAALLVALRPFSNAHRHALARVTASDEVRRRELLRQLRDLDDDFAAGKLSEADHDRLAGPVEREAAAVFRRLKASSRAASDTRGSGTRPLAGGGTKLSTRDVSARVNARSARASNVRPTPKRWRRRTVTLVAVGGGIAGVTLLLLGAISPRTAGETISGNAIAGAASSGSPAPSAASSGGTSADSGQQATPEQLAAIDAAADRVKADPKDVNAHLALADAYEAGGATQLAAVEYLAVTKLDPTNAEANTALAQLAYAVGQTQQAKAMLDSVLAAHPSYPEALYARGLILLTALHQPKAAEMDLNAYLAVAPFGAQRTQAETLLALASSQDR